MGHLCVQCDQSLVFRIRMIRMMIRRRIRGGFNGDATDQGITIDSLVRLGLMELTRISLWDEALARAM